MNRPLSWMLWLLVVAAGVTLILRVQDGLQRPQNIFPSYYTAAQLIAEGSSVAQFYDDSWFKQRAAEFEPNAIEIHNANTPLMGFFFLPLVHLSYDTARRLTSAIAFAALLAAGYLMAAELKIVGAWRALGFAGMLVAPASLSNLEHAQVYLIVLLLLVLAWRAWRRGRDVLGGALIGVALTFKSAGLFLVPLMIIERRWKALSATAGIIAVLALATFPFVGLDGWMAYLQYASEMTARASLSFHGYWSVTSFARNLFRYDEQWSTAPYFDSPAFALAIEVLLFIGFLAAACRAAALTKDRDIAFALFVLLSLILVPVTSLMTTCLAFLPAFVIFSRIEPRLLSPLGAWFVLGMLMSFAPGVERLSVLAQWGGPLFLYARLLGLIILTILCLLLALEKRAALPWRQTPEPMQSGR
jgi:hypothetical protein